MPSLNSNEELNNFQIGFDSFDSFIYDLKIKKFRQITKFDYIKFNGLSYNAIWTLGCPFSCTYCSNSGFANLDKGYLKLRYCEPEYMVNALAEAIKMHPYVTRINFQDDNLIVLPVEIIKLFSELYKKNVGVPFSVFGIHPNTCNKEKIEILASAGLIRVKMGIQSGSEKTLKLYERNTSINTIEKSVEILSNCAKKYKLAPPLYDVIVDNPVETREDIVASLRLFNNLKRPLMLNVFSLRAFPGTKLTEYFDKNKIECYNPKIGYNSVRPTIENILVYCISMFHIPSSVLEYFIRFVQGYNETQKEHHNMLFLIHFLYLVKRFVSNLSKGDFSPIFGSWPYWYWRTIKLLKGDRFDSKKTSISHNT